LIQAATGACTAVWQQENEAARTLVYPEANAA